MTIKEVIIAATVLCFSCANGSCPAQENGTTVLLPLYQRTSSISLNDSTIRTAIQNFLNRSENVGVSSPEISIVSCKKIDEEGSNGYSSGYYWIQGVSGAVKVYCEMGNNNAFNQSGGWMRVANVDMRNNHSQCPPGLVYNVTEGRRLCRKPSLAPGCYSTIFSTQGVEYRQVCGKVVGYQYFKTNGFGPSRYTPEINETYIDGISLTHGSPRQHVWSFAAAHDELYDSDRIRTGTNCPCLHPFAPFVGVLPDFVGEDYYCETGSRREVEARYYFDDPLWNGEGCEGKNECCDRGGPWFCKQLPQPTQDDIEMRVCTNNKRFVEDVVLEQIELYIQ